MKTQYLFNTKTQVNPIYRERFMGEAVEGEKIPPSSLKC